LLVADQANQPPVFSDYIPLHCQTAYDNDAHAAWKAGTTPAYKPLVPDATKDRALFNTTLKFVPKHETDLKGKTINDGLENMKCIDGRAFKDVLGNDFKIPTWHAVKGGVYRKTYLNAFEKEGIPTEWGCQNKATFSGNTETLTKKKQTLKGRNFAETKGMDAEQATLIHPNIDSWAGQDGGASCSSAKSTSCPESNTSCISNPDEAAEKCGFLSGTYHEYTRKHNRNGKQEMVFAKMWAAVINCITGSRPIQSPLQEHTRFAENEASNLMRGMSHFVEDIGIDKKEIDFVVGKYVDTTITNINMNPGIAIADENIDSWSFIMQEDEWDAPTRDSEKLFEPVTWGMAPSRQWVSSDMTLSPAIKNDATLPDSTSCDCGGYVPVYRVLREHITMVGERKEFQRINGATRWKQLLTPASTGKENTNVMFAVAGYGWDKNVDDLRYESAIGLYLPSNPIHEPLTLYERDILKPTGPTPVTENDLVDLTFLNKVAPTEETLKGLLVNLDNLLGGVRSSRFTETKTWFKYGSCMRYPYGQLPRMSMDAPLQQKYFEPCNNTTHGCVDSEYMVLEKSRMGYCEQFGENYALPYCANDPFTVLVRQAFCKKPKATHIVLGIAVRDRNFHDICSAPHKTCWVIPGTPAYPTLASVIDGSNSHALSDYTIMIAPFNWTTIDHLLGPNRAYHTLGFGPTEHEEKIEDLPDDDTKQYGTRALSKETFSLLLHSGSATIHEIEQATAEIIEVLAETCKDTKTNTNCDMSTLNLPTNVQLADVLHQPSTDKGIRILYDGLHIRSSAPANNPLLFKRDPLLVDSPTPCTQFFVSAKRFKINMAADQAGCTNMPALDRALVVFGGPNVSGAHVTLAPTLSQMPVAFVGDDTMSFSQTSHCFVGDTYVNIISSPDVLYSVGMARSSGTVHVEGDMHPAIVQPMRSDTLSINRRVVNISLYTEVFGDALMMKVYSEHLAVLYRLILPIFIFLVIIIVAGLIVACMHMARWFR